jgi:hypothetical protein
MELASWCPSGAYSFEVAARFLKSLWASGVKFKPVTGEVFTYKLYSADTGITGHHLEKCTKGCPGSFAQCAASLIEDYEV